MSSDSKIRSLPRDNAYVILHQIGKGSYATVHKAINKKTGQICAIKKLPVSDDLVSLINEIGILSDCKCNNIVEFFDSACSETEASIVTEYCCGGSVRDVINYLGGLNEKQITTVIRDVLNALDYIHSKQKIHRDVKAANILLTEDGTAKLCDFGVSEPVELSRRKNGITGTVLWIPPEVIRGDTNCTPAIDIWSLGITIIEMAETQPPYKHLNHFDALEKISNLDEKSPSFTSPSKWSSDMVEFLEMCLEKRPSSRSSARELLQVDMIKLAPPSNTVNKDLVAQVYCNDIFKPGMGSTLYRQTESLVRESSILVNICKERRNKSIIFDQMEGSLNSRTQEFLDLIGNLKELDNRIDDLRNQLDKTMKHKIKLERERNDLRTSLDSRIERKNDILNQLEKLRMKQERYELAEAQRKTKLMSLGAKSG